MNNFITSLILLTLVFSSFCTLSAENSFENFPKRKSGLWETTMVIPLINRKEVFRECVDEKNDQQMLAKTLSNPNIQMGDCANTMNRKGSQYLINFKCVNNGMHINSDVVLSGNFQEKYQGDITIAMKMGENGFQLPNQKIPVSSVRKGNCPNGMKPGVVVNKDGNAFSMIK